MDGVQLHQNENLVLTLRLLAQAQLRCVAARHQGFALQGREVLVLKENAINLVYAHVRVDALALQLVHLNHTIVIAEAVVIV